MSGAALVSRTSPALAVYVFMQSSSGAARIRNGLSVLQTKLETHCRASMITINKVNRPTPKFDKCLDVISIRPLEMLYR